MGEAEEVEGLRPFPVAARRALEAHDPGLVGVQVQAKATESLRQHVEDTPRVILPRADHDKVIRVADERTPPANLGPSKKGALNLGPSKGPSKWVRRRKGPSKKVRRERSKAPVGGRSV